MSPARREPGLVAPHDRPAAGRAGGLLLALLVGVLVGCSAWPEQQEAVPTDGPLTVVVSMTVLADFVGQVGGEHVEVISLVPTGADPHTHEPTPADARTVADADLVVANGVGLEPWFDRLVATAGVDVVWATDGLDAEVVDDEDGRADPHLWMAPRLAIGYVRTIADALADAVPDHAEELRANADAYAAELADTLAAIPEERRVLVTPHDAYAYFAEAYDLEVATVVGVSTEEEPSAAGVQAVVDVVRQRDVPTVFVESTVNRAVIDRIATDAGVDVGDPLYGDSVGEPGSGADSYVGMMRANAAALVDGLADR